MKLPAFLLLLVIISCNQNDRILSEEKKSQIKEKIMKTYGQLAEALSKREYKEVM